MRSLLWRLIECDPAMTATIARPTMPRTAYFGCVLFHHISLRRDARRQTLLFRQGR
jgi:hypothetical protein